MFVRRLVPGAALALLLTLSACGGGGGGGGNTPTDPNAISAVIGPEGGSISHPSGAVVQVPAGLLAAPSTVRVSAIEGNSIGNSETSKPVSPAIAIRFDSSPAESDRRVRVTLPLQNPLTEETYGIAVGADEVVHPIAIDGPMGQGSVTLDVPIEATGPSRAVPAWVIAVGIRVAAELLIDPTPRVDLYRFEATAGEGAGFGSGWTGNPSTDWTGKRVAIVVHGINNRLTNLNSLARYLRDLRTPQGRAMYDEVYGCDTEWQASIAQNGDLLAQRITEHAKPGARVDLYGHSQGGLVCRHAVEGQLKGTEAGSKVERLFTLGTPHNGVPIGILRLFSENRILKDQVPGVLDLRDTSAFVRNLNGGEGVSTQYVLLGGDHHSGYFEPLGTSAYLMNGPGDGIVPLQSALSTTAAAQGRESHILPKFGLNHSDMGGRADGPFFLNLDTNGGQKLRDYILGTGSTGVIIQ